MSTTIHNLQREAMRPGDIRIDRRTEHGNEFVLGRDGTRPQVIAKFKVAELARLSHPVTGAARRAKVRAMHGRRLFCHCRPRHATGTSTPSWRPSWWRRRLRAGSGSRQHRAGRR